LLFFKKQGKEKKMKENERKTVSDSAEFFDFNA